MPAVCHTAAGRQHAFEYGGQDAAALCESSETRIGVSLRRYFAVSELKIGTSVVAAAVAN